jgi:hypothetical protein
MIQVLKNKIFLGSLIAVLSVFMFSINVNATTLTSTATTDVCLDGSSYSTLTENKCSSSNVIPLPPVYIDTCTTGAVFSTATGQKCSDLYRVPPDPVDEVCLAGSIKMYSTTTGKPYCGDTTVTTPPTWVPPVKIDGCIGTNIFSTVTGQSCSDLILMPPVRVNSTTDIKGIQALLNNILGLDLSVDGRAGAKTREAVKIFQRKAGLSADGIVGPKTMAKLNASVQ